MNFHEESLYQNRWIPRFLVKTSLTPRSVFICLPMGRKCWKRWTLKKCILLVESLTVRLPKYARSFPWDDWNQNLSYNRAKSLSIPSYRLPIDKYVTTYQRPGMRFSFLMTVVLNVNTMVELFASYLHTNDWKVSFEACLPKRKQKAEKNSVHMDYHEIEDNHIDIRTIQMNQLYQYQLKHCLHIYCVKKNIQLDIQNIDHCNIFYSTLKIK